MARRLAGVWACALATSLVHRLEILTDCALVSAVLWDKEMVPHLPVSAERWD